MQHHREGLPIEHASGCCQEAVGIIFRVLLEEEVSVAAEPLVLYLGTSPPYLSSREAVQGNKLQLILSIDELFNAVFRQCLWGVCRDGEFFVPEPGIEEGVVFQASLLGATVEVVEEIANAVGCALDMEPTANRDGLGQASPDFLSVTLGVVSKLRENRSLNGLGPPELTPTSRSNVQHGVQSAPEAHPVAPVCGKGRLELVREEVIHIPCPGQKPLGGIALMGHNGTVKSRLG